MNIALDIGHANNTGARGNGIEEHAIATVIAKLVATLLREEGHTIAIIDYPDSSNSDDLNATIRQANKGDYDIGISIHCDCSDNLSAHGAHACYYSSSGLRLARAISAPLCKLMPGRADYIVKRDNLAMLKQTRATWALIECGFISNPNDSAIMKHNPQAIAKAIVEGIKTYLKHA